MCVEGPSLQIQSLFNIQWVLGRWAVQDYTAVQLTIITGSSLEPKLEYHQLYSAVWGSFCCVDYSFVALALSTTSHKGCMSRIFMKRLCTPYTITI